MSIKLSCNFCPYGTPKTDMLLLIRVKNRDFLACMSHSKRIGNVKSKHKSGKDI
jgi:hypothetical protein